MTAQTKSCDVCIIGAGPAGALCANALTEKGHSVVVLEAGKHFSDDLERRRMEKAIRPGYSDGEVWDMGGKRDAYSSVGNRFYPLNQTRVKGIGGSTLHWQGMVMRLHTQDFQLKSSTGLGTDWPISYTDLKPYYAAAEKRLGVAGASDNPFAPPRDEPFPMPAFPPSYSDSLFAEACEDLGIAIHSVPNARNSEPYNNRDQCVGYGTCQPVCPSGAKYSADSTIERASQKGAKIITQAPVQKLEHDKAGDEITAAVYISANNTIQEQEADEFIIACGGVETPRLLLLSSSSEYPDGLANSSGLVGKFFMDHLFAGVGGRLDMQTGYNEIGFNTSESHQFYDRQNGDRGAIKLEFLNYTAPTPVTNTPIEDALTGNTWGDELQQSLKEKYGNHIAVGALIEQLPNADNQIRLSKSQTDDHGNPVPVIDWNIDDFTKQTIKRANEIQSSILEALDADITWKIGPKDTGPAAHHMGTTRMGTDPNHSVVKPTLQTHDIDNLSIASSSVFPTAGAMNPTLTIAALALKTADHVDERL